MDDRSIDPEAGDEDREFDHTLRPNSLAEMLGQKKTKQQLGIAIEAARQRNEAMDHILLHGPPGLGKTTLSYVIAKELGVEIHPTSGPLLERPTDLVGMLTSMGPRDVLFIDDQPSDLQLPASVELEVTEQAECDGLTAAVTLSDEVAAAALVTPPTEAIVHRRVSRRQRDIAEAAAAVASTAAAAAFAALPPSAAALRAEQLRMRVRMREATRARDLVEGTADSGQARSASQPERLLDG